MVNLYHFSEEPDIRVFEPRPPVARPDVEPLVWAIDGWHSPMYLFPRDCPRILMWPLETTTPEDRERHWGGREVRMVAHMEWAWFERLRTTCLYRYTMPAETFETLNDAGMWVSRSVVKPHAIESVADLLAALAEANVELRLMPSLLPLRGAWETTMHASGIRLRNARGWGEGLEAPAGFEPAVKLLQSSALPLGHGAAVAVDGAQGEI